MEQKAQGWLYQWSVARRASASCSGHVPTGVPASHKLPRFEPRTSREWERRARCFTAIVVKLPLRNSNSNLLFAGNLCAPRNHAPDLPGEAARFVVPKSPLQHLCRTCIAPILHTRIRSALKAGRLR